MNLDLMDPSLCLTRAVRSLEFPQEVKQHWPCVESGLCIYYEYIYIGVVDVEYGDRRPSMLNMSYIYEYFFQPLFLESHDCCFGTTGALLNSKWMAFPPRSWSQALLKLGCWARDAGCIHRESFLTFLSFIHELSCAWHLHFDVQIFEICYMMLYDIIVYYTIFLSILSFKIIHIIILQICCGNWMSHWPMHQSRMSQVELEGQSLKREPIYVQYVCVFQHFPGWWMSWWFMQT